MAKSSTPKERLDAVTAHWLDVSANHYRNMAATRTSEEAHAVERVFNTAERAYVDAIADGLTAESPAVDNAYAALVRATRAARKARDEQVEFAETLALLTKATAAAERLVKAAANIAQPKAQILASHQVTIAEIS